MSDPTKPQIDAVQFPATTLLFRDDAYSSEAESIVVGAADGLLMLDSALFYPASGGQPADHGILTRDDGVSVEITELRYLDAAKTRVGFVLPDGNAESWIGARVHQRLDMKRRMTLMRMHSALHLLSVALPYAVTGGSVGIEDSRLDFDIPDGGLDKDEITAALNAMIAKNAAITDSWISDAELDANPNLVKTMKVQPPRGAGKVRLVEIAGLDLQPCGGTHVRNTSEIGAMRVTNIEKKGMLNRRVRIAFA